MACFHPITGWRRRTVNADTGKRGITFNIKEGFRDMPVTVPCGQCIGCRLDRSRQWAIRCVHEATLHDSNVFVTLTYNQENLPPGGSLVVQDFQKFMKRLRKKMAIDGIKFFHCGEYGEKMMRPHYHACLFGIDFPDKKLWKIKHGVKLFTSEVLNKTWGKGYCVIGDVTFESAAYVARYIMKKITGPMAAEHYPDMPYGSPGTEGQGEVIQVKPEYTTMSRGGRTGKGLASGWFEKYQGDVFPADHVIIKGREMKPPRYYDYLYDLENKSEFGIIKSMRKARALARAEDNTRERLADKEACKISQINYLKRGYENDD